MITIGIAFTQVITTTANLDICFLKQASFTSGIVNANGASDFFGMIQIAQIIVKLMSNKNEDFAFAEIEGRAGWYYNTWLGFNG